MSDGPKLEHDVRRALRARADGLAVADRGFDPADTTLSDVSDADLERPAGRGSLRLLLVTAVVIVVLASAAVVAVHNGGSNDAVHVGGSPTTSSPSSVAPQLSAADLAAVVGSVPTDVSATVGQGSENGLPTALPGPVLSTKDGKPRILYIGAEYCPYCAAQRWPLVQALSRFGTFSGLGLTSSAATTPNGAPEVFPKTQSFSFHGATYRSDYIQFESVEEETNTFKPLETPTPEQEQLFVKFDAPPYVDGAATGAIPFLDFANTFLISGVSYDAQVLQDHTHAEIASVLSEPTNDIAQGIDGTANVMTATICRLTDNKPAAVCNAPTITTIEGLLPHQP